MYVCMYICMYQNDVGVCVCMGVVGVLIKVFKNKNNMYLNFKLNLKKVVFAWYLEWDGDGGANKKKKKKKKKTW